MSVTVETFEALCKELRDKRTEYEEAKRVASELNSQVEAIENKLAECLHESDKDSYKSEYGTISLNFRTYYKVPKGEDFELVSAFWKQKYGKDPFLTYNSNAYNSAMKKEVEAAQERGEVLEVPGAGTPTVTPIISFRKK